MDENEKNKLSVKKIVGGCLSLIFFIICLVFIISFVSSKVTGNPPSLFGYSISYVPTNSMEPTIPSRSYVMFKKAEFNELNVGDVVVYKAKEGKMAGNFIIHRINEIVYNEDGTYSYFVTLGDNNFNICDEYPVTSDMVYGKYVCNAEFLNFMNGFSNNNLIFLLIIIVFAVTIVVEMFNVSLTLQREKLKKEEKAKETNEQEALEELRKQIYEEEKAKLLQASKDKDEM